MASNTIKSSHSIRILRFIPFYPGSDLRKLCKTLDYTLYKSDSSADSDKDPLPDDGDDNQGGSGSGVTPDPSV